MAYYKPHYHPTAYSSKTLLRAPIVFVGVLGGLWVISTIQWIESPVSFARGWIENLIIFISSQVSDYLSEAETQEVAMSAERVVYAKYAIMAIFVFVGTMIRSLLMTLFVGVFLGALFQPELSSLPLFSVIADRSSGFIGKSFSPLFN